VFTFAFATVGRWVVCDVCPADGYGSGSGTAVAFALDAFAFVLDQARDNGSSIAETFFFLHN
jgi:hypothetical protein